MQWRRKDLVAQVAKRTGYPKRIANQVCRELFSTIKEQIDLGNTVEWAGFGTWRTTPLASRNARNPQTGERFKTKPRRRAHFTWAPSVKDYYKDEAQ